MQKHLTYANVMATLAVVLVVAGGTAYAANTIGSSDIINGQVKSADIGTGQVQSIDVKDDGLTAADVDESTLGEVPSAQLGGLGRSSSAGSCNPENLTDVVCAVVTRNLAAQSRLLLIAQGTGMVEAGRLRVGTCHIGTTSGPLLATETEMSIENGPSGVAAHDAFTLVGVTAPLPPGQHSFGLDCHENQFSGGIEFKSTGITTVAISRTDRRAGRGADLTGARRGPGARASRALAA